MTWLLRSPFSRLLDKSVMLITVRGRRTGAEYALPVQYAQGEKAIWVIAAHHERKTWWRNLLAEGPVVLRVRGHELNGRAQALAGESAPAEVEQGLCTYFRRFPGLARRYGIAGKGGSIDPGLLRDLAKRTVMVRVVPGQEDAAWPVGSAVPGADPEACSEQGIKPRTPGYVATAPAAAMVPGQGSPAGAEGGHGIRWLESARLLRNAFLLILPVLVWDAILTPYLPAAYQSAVRIPLQLATGENVTRWLVVLVPILMPLAIKTTRQRIGLIVYALGILLYFTSWLVPILSPTSSWSTSAAGFLAPAYTPAVWLAGITLIGDSLYVRRLPYRAWVLRHAGCRVRVASRGARRDRLRGEY